MRKFKLLTSLFFLSACLMLNLEINAQRINDSEIKAQMATDWQRAKDYTNEYLHTMPDNKYGAKAVDSIRSFAQQMLHLTAANVYIMSGATGESLPSWVSFSMEGRPSACAPDSVRYYVNLSYDYCIKAVNNSDPAKWGEKVKMFGQFEATRFAFMQKAFEHQTHHRGQSTIYIRLQGIKPPQEKLF